jgi:hypothetical protein
MGTTRFMLPIPLDKPVSGQDLLDVFQSTVDPIMQRMGCVGIFQVATIAPLAVLLRGTKAVPAWPMTGYAPAVGDWCVCIYSQDHVIALGGTSAPPQP